MHNAFECPVVLLDLRSDDQLIHEVGHGDADRALRAIETRYGRRLHHFVRGLVKDAHLASDVTQEVLEKAYLKNHLYTPGTSFRAWLFEVARNQALSALRKRKRSPRPVTSLTPRESDQPGTDVLDQIAAPDTGRDLEEQEFLAAFTKSVANLPERYRAVFQICIQQGRTYEEAAKELEIPTGTVAIRIMRARRRLYDALKIHLGRLRRPPACLQG